MAYKSSVPSIKSSSIQKNQSFGTINHENKENKESTTLLWFDPNIGSREDAELTKQQLRLINDYVILHTDLHQCVAFIQSIDKEKIFLIVSGSKASQLLSHVSSLQQIDSIFLFCMKKEKYENLRNEYSNIIGIYVNLNELCQSIKEQVNLLDQQLQTFSFFDQYEKSTKDLSTQSSEFLWFQLFNYVITRLPRNQQAKQQMIDMCRGYYRGNIKELKLIDQFEREYRSEDAIRWYSKQSFVYKLINKALRTEDIDLLYTFRFFISDLSKSLSQEHEKILLSEGDILTVYRGVKIDKEEYDKLKENQGKLISTNGYLSTSRLRSQALSFVKKPTKRTDVISGLFQIKCDLKQLDQNIIFADIAKFSDYPYEEEVLFDLNVCFQIESIELDGSIQLIKMNLSNDGQTIIKDYLKLTQEETEEKSVSIVFGRLMCNLGQYDKSQKYFEQLLNDPNGEDLLWIEFNIGRVLHFKGEWKEAREYYDRVYDRMVNATPARIKDSAYALHNIGNILYQQGKQDEALDYQRRGLEIRKRFYTSDHVDIAYSLGSIGDILRKQRKFDEALDYYQRALKIKEKLYPSNHIDIAYGLGKIGRILDDQGKYDKARDYHKQALKMKEKYYPSDHIDIAMSFYCLGVNLHKQGKHDEALDYHQRALKIREKFYPCGHVNTTYSLGEIGRILHKQRKYDEALDYHQRALGMKEKFHPFGHVSITYSLDNIGRILDDQGKYDEALGYHQRALKMKEKVVPV